MLENRQSAHYWSNSHAQMGVTHERPISAQQNMLETVPFSELQQGELYIIKIKLVVIALFQGWDDDMCCFSVLRSDLVMDSPVRWSEARYLPNDFDAYPAFDRLGNPPIHLWSKNISSGMPYNWFSMFEEARQWQRQWHACFEEPIAQLEPEHHNDEVGTSCGSESQSQHHQKPHLDETATTATADEEEEQQQKQQQQSQLKQADAIAEDEKKETDDSVTCGSHISQDAVSIPQQNRPSSSAEEVHSQQHFNHSACSLNSSVSASESLLKNRAHVRDYILRPQAEEPVNSRPTPAVQLRKQYREPTEVTQQQLPSLLTSSSSISQQQQQQVVVVPPPLVPAQVSPYLSVQAQAVLSSQSYNPSSSSSSSSSSPPLSSLPHPIPPPPVPRSSSLPPVTPLPPLHNNPNPPPMKQSRSLSSDISKTISSTPIKSESEETEVNLKQRRSLSSFFSRKKKSKKPAEEAKKDTKNRKSAPPTPRMAPKKTTSLIEAVPSLSTSTTMPTLTNVSGITTSGEEKTKKRISSIKPSKSMASMNSKMELYDMDSLLDLQATFAFLNGDHESSSLVQHSPHLAKAV